MLFGTEEQQLVTNYLYLYTAVAKCFTVEVLLRVQGLSIPTLNKGLEADGLGYTSQIVTKAITFQCIHLYYQPIF